MKRTIFSFFLLSLFIGTGFSQDVVPKPEKVIDYTIGKKYEIGGITVSGVKFLSKSVLAQLSGLRVGETIDVPGNQITEAMENYWEQGLFSDVKITSTKIVDGKIFLDIYLQEQPRLSRFSFSGVNKTESEDIREKVNLIKGSQVTSNLMDRTKKIARDHFVNKGYLNTEVSIVQKEDTVLANSAVLDIKIEKNEKVKIREIIFDGATVIPPQKLRRSMKETKQKTWYNVFKTSKYIRKNVDDDLDLVLEKYNEFGYRDARILGDTLVKNPEDGTVSLVVKVQEGKQYFFRDITWVGYPKYRSPYRPPNLQKFQSGHWLFPQPDIRYPQYHLQGEALV